MRRIVFSDGSKAMAHNTDDLPERHRLRHEAEEGRPLAEHLSDEQRQWIADLLRACIQDIRRSS